MLSNFTILKNEKLWPQVVFYENNSEKAKYNVLEEVKDIGFKPPHMFTARDLYVTVTEIKPGEKLFF